MRIISLLDDKVGDLIYIDREKIGTCHVVMEIFGFRSRSNFWQGWGDAWDVLITVDCSKCERQGHNLFYVDNTVQVRGGLRGTLGEE